MTNQTTAVTIQTTARPVHYYDVQRHHIACSSPGADDHSTKHDRSVTCRECLSVLREVDGQATAMP